VAPTQKLAYDHRHGAQRPGRAARSGEEIGQRFRGNTNRFRLACGRDETEGDMGIEILAVAAGVLAAIWIVVLWGSRYFGPQ
jgi:hypothetical protein